MNYTQLDRRRPHTLLEARLFSVLQSWMPHHVSSNYNIIFLGMANDSLVFYVTPFDLRIVLTYQPNLVCIGPGGSTSHITANYRGFG